MQIIVIMMGHHHAHHHHRYDHRATASCHLQSVRAKLLLANYYLGQSHKHFGMSSRATIIIIIIIIITIPIVVIVLIREGAEKSSGYGGNLKVSHKFVTKIYILT